MTEGRHRQTQETRRPTSRDTVIRPPRHRDSLPPPTGDPGGRRRRPRTELLAVTALIIIAALIGTLVHSELQSAHHRRHERPAASTAPHRTQTSSRARRVPHVRAAPMRALSAVGMPAGPVPPHFTPGSFTAVNAARWWLLGNAPCASPPCTSIVRTDDGGRHFVGIPAPRTTAVTQLRFANARDGWAFNSALWATHDDGANWYPIQLSGSVNDLESSGGYAYAIVRASSGRGELMRSAVGSDAWQALPQAGDVQGGLWVHGADVVLESGGGPGAPQLAVSIDAGHTFRRAPVPPTVACNFVTPGSTVLWADCATGMLSGVWRAVGPLGSAPLRRVTGAGLPEMPNSAVFAAATGDTAVVGYQQLYRTGDGGRSYQRVSTPRGIATWRYLGFTDTLNGVALGATAANRMVLFHTSDGGMSYQRVPIRWP